MENNFVVDAMEKKARRDKRDICFISIDIANAFGSVNHHALLSALRAAGAGDQLLEIIENLYSECYTSFMTKGVISDPVPVNAGVRQGCPLSGILFNIMVDPVLRVLYSVYPSVKIM